jgi:hypothetical protein
VGPRLNIIKRISSPAFGFGYLHCARVTFVYYDGNAGELRAVSLSLLPLNKKSIANKET